MELASYLAGEKWSDHPRCTHSLLAALARDVNDHVSDGYRVWLAPLIPDVIGLNTGDPRAHAWIARDAALAALPIVSAERQGVAAAAFDQQGPVGGGLRAHALRRRRWAGPESGPGRVPGPASVSPWVE